MLFLYSTIETGSDDTFEETVFTFSHTLANDVPVDSVIYVRIPSEITVYNSDDVASTCRSVRSLLSTLKCAIESLADGSHLLTITEAIVSAGLRGNDEVIFKITKGLKTPISTETSSTFTVVIEDKNGYEINFVRKSLSITMRNGRDIGPIDVMPAS